MPEIELSAGTIEYEDSGGDGPAIVLLGGLLMDASLWDACRAPTGASRRRCRSARTGTRCAPTPTSPRAASADWCLSS